MFCDFGNRNQEVELLCQIRSSILTFWDLSTLLSIETEPKDISSNCKWGFIFYNILAKTVFLLYAILIDRRWLPHC